jgi:hypothetical protein
VPAASTVPRWPLSPEHVEAELARGPADAHVEGQQRCRRAQALRRSEVQRVERAGAGDLGGRRGQLDGSAVDLDERPSTEIVEEQ